MAPLAACYALPGELRWHSPEHTAPIGKPYNNNSIYSHFREYRLYYIYTYILVHVVRERLENVILYTN